MGEQDFRTWKDRFHPSHKGPNCRARGIDVLTPKPIVRAGFDHYHLGGIAQQKLDATKRAGRSLAAISLVDDAKREPGRIQLALQNRRIGAVGIEAESGGQRGSNDQQGWTTVDSPR